MATTQPARSPEGPNVLSNLRAMIYHRSPFQACYALGRGSVKALDKVRQETRDQLENRLQAGARIKDALDAIDAVEAEAAIVRDVYGCRAGRACRVATDTQRKTFEAMIEQRLQQLDAWHAS